MIRLQTLGSLDLRAADGTALHVILRQPKRLALLAYLAIEKPGSFHRRDHLLGLFWPETDLKSGRAALSQAIHFLRQALGRDAIINRGDEEIGVASGHVSCDATLFQQHVLSGEYEQAIAIYGGDLLPAFFVDDAAGFEQWLEQKRSDLQRSAMRAASGVADAAERRGDDSDVVRWLRRAIEHFPYDESLHRRLITTLDRMGDRAAALRAYEDLEQTLGREYDSKPSAETQAAIHAVRSRSESQLPHAVELLPRSNSSVLPIPVARKRRTIFASAAFVIIIASVGVWLSGALREPAATAPMNRIAVLFFDDVSAERDLGYLAEGLTSTLIDHLGQVRQLEVISQNGVRPFSADSLPLDSVARHLDVGTVVGGTVSRSGDRLRVMVQMTRGTTGVVTRSRTFERPTGELFSLLDDISAEVASFLRSSVGQEMKFERYRSETRSVPAWQAVQEAELLIAAGHSNPSAGDQSARADSLLLLASELDSRWAQPRSLHARLFIKRAMFSLVRDGLPAAVVLLYSAEAAARQALSVDADHAGSFEERGYARYMRWALAGEPELEHAEADLRRALEIDRDRARAESVLSAVYESQGRFEDARRAALRALEVDAYLLDADQIVTRLFTTSFEVGNDAEAGHWCDEARRRMSGRWPAAWCDLVLIGWTDNGRPDARKALFLVETFGPGDPEPVRAAMRPRIMMLAAAALARSGDADAAHKMIADARRLAPHDVELLPLEAAALIILKQNERANTLLREYFAKNPRATPRIAKGRLFRPLRAGSQRAAS